VPGGSVEISAHRHGGIGRVKITHREQSLRMHQALVDVDGHYAFAFWATVISNEQFK